MIYQILGAEMIKSTLFTAYILNLRWEPPLVNQTTIKNPRFLIKQLNSTRPPFCCRKNQRFYIVLCFGPHQIVWGGKNKKGRKKEREKEAPELSLHLYYAQSSEGLSFLHSKLRKNKIE